MTLTRDLPDHDKNLTWLGYLFCLGSAALSLFLVDLLILLVRTL